MASVKTSARSTPRLVLASQSPRRRALLAEAGFRFRAVSPGVDETPRPGERPEAYAVRAARDKARAVAGRLSAVRVGARVVLGCDTVVILGGRILGKPASRADAARMLCALSGRSHTVCTGVALLAETAAGRRRMASFRVVTRVRFRRLSSDDIARYVACGEPMDKAGAYGIQQRAAGMVLEIQGSYTNVVGLPLAELTGRLAMLGVRPVACARPCAV
jgi:septum formation protein